MIRSCMALSQLLGKHSYKRPNATPKIDRLADLFSVLPPSVSVINDKLACLRSRQAWKRRLEYSVAHRIAGCEAKRRGAR
jgi:hypothetical protein